VTRISLARQAWKGESAIGLLPKTFRKKGASGKGSTIQKGGMARLIKMMDGRGDTPNRRGKGNWGGTECNKEEPHAGGEGGEKKTQRVFACVNHKISKNLFQLRDEGHIRKQIG